MNWIEDLALHRNAQNTNVYLIETLDFARLDQFMEALRNGDFPKLLNKDYTEMIEHDIQRQTLRNIVGETDLSVDPMGPYAQLDRMLRGRPTIVVIKYAVLPVHAEALSNVIVPWSHDQNLYRHKSTVVIFTSSLRAFPRPHP